MKFRTTLLAVGVSVPPAIMVVTGYGDADPVATNETPQGRSKNRRVVMDIISAN